MGTGLNDLILITVTTPLFDSISYSFVNRLVPHLFFKVKCRATSPYLECDLSCFVLSFTAEFAFASSFVENRPNKAHAHFPYSTLMTAFPLLLFLPLSKTGFVLVPLVATVRA